MKTFSCIMIVVLLLFCSIGLQAQTTQPKLNQVDLMKQFLGSWKCDFGKDTMFVMECKSFYDGFDFYLKIETKGKIIFEQKTLVIM